jgi:transposase
MAWAHSIDLRERVVAAYAEGGESYESVAARFRVGRATVDRWLRRHRETGSVAPLPHRSGNRAKVDDRGLDLLRELVEAKPDATLAELATAYRERTTVKLALCMVHRALARLSITRKKRLSTRRSVKPIA